MTDLATHRTARQRWQSDEDRGRRLFLELRAEARAHTVALVAAGAL